MDKDIARHIAKVAFRSWSQMADLVYWLKFHCEPAEHKEIGKAIARACGEVIFEVQNKMYALYPELEREYEETIKKYERSI